MASRPSSNKMVRGSLPCGNPKRYTSADVVQMQKNGGKTSMSTEVSIDQQERSDYIQTLLKHQTRTDITFKEQFSQHRSFVALSSHAPTVDRLDGLHTTQEHVKFNHFDSRVDYLKSCGLTAQEIEFKLKRDISRESRHSKTQGYGADPVTDQMLEEEIDRKIREKEDTLKEPDKFNGGLEMSRHALVLEKSMLAKQSKQSTLPECLFKQRKLEARHPDDPINKIGDILCDIEPKPVRVSRRDRRRKRKLHDKLLRQQEYLCVESNPDMRKEFMKSVGVERDSSPEYNNDVNNSEISCDISVNCTSTSAEWLLRDISHKKQECTNLSNDESKSTTNCESLEQDQNVDSKADNFQINDEEQCKHKEQFVRESKKKKKCPSNSNSGLFTMSSFGSDVPCLTDSEIRVNRLTDEEILCMDKFKNYEKGSRNKIVFVKNLPNNPCEADLISMFGRFQRDSELEISFRLLKGRMRGQAFVTFPDSDTAEEAISTLNGYKLRGKPVILSYGNRQDGYNGQERNGNIYM